MKLGDRFKVPHGKVHVITEMEYTAICGATAWMMDKLILMTMEATGKTPFVYTLWGQYPYHFGPIVIQVPKGELDAPEAHRAFKQVRIPPSLKNNTEI